MALLQSSGRLSFLRVHETRTRYGPPTDQIDVEVIFGLEGKTGAFGFQLRDDAFGPARRAMLDLLRDAFSNGWVVHTDYEIEDGRKNGIVIRVWLTRPRAEPAKKFDSPTPIVVMPSLQDLD